MSIRPFSRPSRPSRPRATALASLALSLVALGASTAQAQQDQVLQRTFGGRSCRVFVPGSYRAGTPRPLVVMLHGCTQDPADFARGTGFDDVARRHGLIVLYPRQPESANQNKCWNWFEPGHQARGAGEPASIVACVTGVASEWSVDPERVYVAGLSAGGAMSSILGATYPDVFAAIGVHSGLQYAAARGVGGAFSAMYVGGPDPLRGARDVLQAMGARQRALPTIVFHGTGDRTVVPRNGEQTLAQFAQVADLALNGVDDDELSAQPTSTRRDQVAGGRSYSVFDHAFGAKTWLRRYEVEGMEHAWSGGAQAGSYTDPSGPSASEALWSFFAQHTRSGGAPAPTAPAPTAPAPTTPAPTAPAPTAPGADRTPPQTTLTPPGASYPGPVKVEFMTNEPAETYYTLDGTRPSLSSARYSGAFKISADATLRYFSVDRAGNQSALESATFQIAGGTKPCPCAPKVLSLKSRGDLDGWVARYRAWGGGADRPQVGDRGMFQVDLYRGLLSFDTSQLPLNARVLAVTLRVRRASGQGSLGALRVDAQGGSFGISPGLGRDDFDSPASAPGCASLSAPASDGAWSEVDLPAATYADLSQGSLQVRLRAANTPSFKAALLELFGGEDGASAPELVIRYVQP